MTEIENKLDIKIRNKMRKLIILETEAKLYKSISNEYLNKYKTAMLVMAGVNSDIENLREMMESISND